MPNKYRRQLKCFMKIKYEHAWDMLLNGVRMRIEPVANETSIAASVEPRAPKTAQWGRLAPWGLLLMLLALEYFFFRRYALNEVVWSYPGIYDQAVYLQHSY